jgi:hypothetical protein
MKKPEKILLGFLTVGAILKLIGVAGGALAITLSATILVLYYFPFGFLTLKGQPEEGKIKGYPISAGFALATACLTVLFLLQRWPGAAMYFWYGVSFSFVILVYSAVKTDMKDFKSYHGAMKLRSGLLFVLVLLAVIRFTLVNQIQ